MSALWAAQSGLVAAIGQSGGAGLISHTDEGRQDGSGGGAGAHDFYTGVAARIERIRNARAIGYVTKYLTKSVAVGERGTKEVQHERLVVIEDEQGQAHTEKQVFTEEVASKAHRIRYSHNFFPAKVSELRARLFAGLENETMEQSAVEVVEVTPAEQGENGLPLISEESQQEQEAPRSPWMLKEKEGFTNDIEEYRLRKRKALLSAIKDLHSGTIHVSRRVIGIWDYQRQEVRRAG